MNKEQFHEMSPSRKRRLAQDIRVTQATQLMLIREDYVGKQVVLKDLAKNHSITEEAQKLLIESDYCPVQPPGVIVLAYLAMNPSIAPTVQMALFNAGHDEEFQREVLFRSYLSGGQDIELLSCLVLCDENGYGSRFVPLYHLAQNTNITPECQKLFFTENYKGKLETLECLAANTRIGPEVQKMFITEKYEGKKEILRTLDAAGNTSSLQGYIPQDMLSLIDGDKTARLLIYSARLQQGRRALTDGGNS